MRSAKKKGKLKKLGHNKITPIITVILIILGITIFCYFFLYESQQLGQIQAKKYSAEKKIQDAKNEANTKQAYIDKFDSVISPVPSGFHLINEEFYYVHTIDALPTLTRTYKVNSTRGDILKKLESLFTKNHIDTTHSYATGNMTNTNYKIYYQDWFADPFSVYLDPEDKTFPSNYIFSESTPVNQVTIHLTYFGYFK